MPMPPPAEPRRSFDGAVEVYHEIRPGYPPSMFDELFRLLPGNPEVIEVGPGTGKATGDLLRRGASVHAVEIGPAMAAKLQMMTPPARQGLLDEMENFIRQHYGNQVTRPIVVTLTTARLS